MVASAPPQSAPITRSSRPSKERALAGRLDGTNITAAASAGQAPASRALDAGEEPQASDSAGTQHTARTEARNSFMWLEASASAHQNCVCRRGFVRRAGPIHFFHDLETN